MPPISRYHLLDPLGVSTKEFADLLRAADLPVSEVSSSTHDNTSPADAASIDVLVTTQSPIQREVLERFSSARLILVAFSGYEHVDLGAIHTLESEGRLPITVCYCPDYAADSTAELTVTLLGALFRHIRSHVGHAEHQLSITPALGNTIRGKRIALLGLGQIGMRVAQLLAPYGCHLLGWSRTRKLEFELPPLLGTSCRNLADACQDADAISLHLRATIKTEQILDEAFFRGLRGKPWLVNTARASLINHHALLAAVRSGHIQGAALDLLPSGPPDLIQQILFEPSILALPHLGFRTHEAYTRRLDSLVSSIRGYCVGRPVHLVVPPQPQ